MKKITTPIPTKRTPSQQGKWVYKPLRSTIVVCVCGNKYIVTRKDQVKCIGCMYSKEVK